MQKNGFTPTPKNSMFKVFSKLFFKSRRIWQNKKMSYDLVWGFTLIELIVVIAVIGVMAGTVLVASSRGLDQARDARRIEEAFQISNALSMYQAANKTLPISTDINDSGCVFYGITWDKGSLQDSSDEIIKELENEGFMTPTPKEWRSVTVGCTYRYAKVTDPCDGLCPGTYSILYVACESNKCPTKERPACCDGSSWTEGVGEADKSDIFIFVKQLF